MPQFAPSAQKTAVAPITVAPAGLNCEVELFLGPNDATPVASSGIRTFLSTGSPQQVSFPITMPASPGTYHVYVDVYAGGQLILAYIGSEDVIIQVPALPFTYTFSCTLGTCPSATAYGIPQMSGTIRNNNSVLLSQNVKVMWKRYSRTYSEWYSSSLCPISECLANPFLVSLSPGTQRGFSYQGYCWAPGYDLEACRPLLMKNYDYYFWLEDVGGGKSNEVILRT